MIVEVNKENIDNIFNDSKNKVIVDFWIPGCEPCETMIPIFTKVSELENVVVAKINVMDFQELIEKYDLKGAPTILFLLNKEVKYKHLGTLTYEEIINNLNKL